MIFPFLKRAVAAALALCLAAQSGLADVSQASLWSERRAARETPKPVLASLPAGLPAITRTLARPTAQPASSRVAPNDRLKPPTRSW